MSPLEERMAKVEGILEEVRTRLNHLESRMDGLETTMATEFSQLRQEINANNRELRQEMRTRFRWTLGIMLGVLIPMWVTIILAIL